MRPNFFLAFFAAVGLTCFGLAMSDRPVRADVIDAGPAGGVGSSPVKLEIPTPQTPAPPDALEHPTEAISAVTSTYQHSGLWAGVMMALWVIFQALGKRSGPGSFLGDGRMAAGIAAGSAIAGSGVDVLTLHPAGGWLVVAAVALMGGAMVLSPHVKHDDGLASP